MITYYTYIGTFIFSAAALWFSIWALIYNLKQTRKWYRIAQSYKETIRMLSKELSKEEQELMFSKFTTVEKQNEKL